jgi:hypothetical protein
LNRNKILIKLTRDSVCAADDADAPHEKNISIPVLSDTNSFVTHLASGFLPKISGEGHTWDCILDNKIITKISISGIENEIDQIIFSTNNHVHFKYHSANY